MPLILPGTVLRDRPGIVHVVLIIAAGRQLAGTDGAVPDMPPSAAGRHGTCDVIDHRDVRSGSDRSIVSHPDIGLDTTSRIGGAAAGLVPKFRDDESGFRSRLKNK